MTSRPQHHTLMQSNRFMPPGTIIPEIGYVHVGEAAAWLCAAFGFTERLRIGGHRAQFCFGDGSVIVVGRPANRAADLAGGIQSTSSHGGENGYTVMVRVEDVDAHHERARQHGAQIIQPPADYPFGERQYTAEDLAGHR